MVLFYLWIVSSANIQFYKTPVRVPYSCFSLIYHWRYIILATDTDSVVKHNAASTLPQWGHSIHTHTTHIDF